MDGPVEEFFVDARPGSVAVGGEVDMETAERLRDALAQACASAEPQVEVDMSQVSFIDSSGINELLRIRQNGCRVIVTGMSATVARTFTLLGLDQVFDLTSSTIADGTTP